MASDKAPEITERESLKVAEASRQAEWEKPSFMRELFLGNFRLDLVHPFPLPGEERPEFRAFFDTFSAFVRDEWNAVEVDATGEYPERLVEELRRLGAFGLKSLTRHGGPASTTPAPNRVLPLPGCCDGTPWPLLSAPQPTGVPQPLKLFGSAELKKKSLPRCAAGEISAFALTEIDVGSD